MKVFYEILLTRIENTGEAPIGQDIFYRCGICQSTIPSTGNFECLCGNIRNRESKLSVKDYSSFIVLKRVIARKLVSYSARKKGISYETLQIGIKNTSEVPIGRDIFYRCGVCQSILPSMPKGSIRCLCNNMEIDNERDLHRLFVRDYSNVVVLRKMSHNIGKLTSYSAMKREFSFEVIQTEIKDTREAPIGQDIFYQCGICQSIIPSMPKDNTDCLCGNLGIDKDMHRLWVNDYSNFVVLRKVVHDANKLTS